MESRQERQVQLTGGVRRARCPGEFLIGCLFFSPPRRNIELFSV